MTVMRSMNYRKVLGLLTVVLMACIISVKFAPGAYRSYVTDKLAHILDTKYGQEGWVAAWVVSDGQANEQIDLYRTIYVRFLYPRFQTWTPYRGLTFTHKTGWAKRPPHYAILIYAYDGEYAYRWSICKNTWYIAYQNSIVILPPRDQDKIRRKLKEVRRVDGLNLPQASEKT